MSDISDDEEVFERTSVSEREKSYKNPRLREDLRELCDSEEDDDDDMAIQEHGQLEAQHDRADDNDYDDEVDSRLNEIAHFEGDDYDDGRMPEKEAGATELDFFIVRNSVPYKVGWAYDPTKPEVSDDKRGGPELLGPGRVRDYGTAMVVEDDDQLGKMDLPKSWPHASEFDSKWVVVIKAKTDKFEMPLPEARDKGPFGWYARVITKSDEHKYRTTGVMSDNYKIGKPIPPKVVRDVAKWLSNDQSETKFFRSRLVKRYQPNEDIYKRPFPCKENNWKRVDGIKGTGTKKKSNQESQEKEENQQSSPQPSRKKASESCESPSVKNQSVAVEHEGAVAKKQVEMSESKRSNSEGKKAISKEGNMEAFLGKRPRDTRPEKQSEKKMDGGNGCHIAKVKSKPTEDEAKVEKPIAESTTNQEAPKAAPTTDKKHFAKVEECILSNPNSTKSIKLTTFTCDDVKLVHSYWNGNVLTIAEEKAQPRKDNDGA